MFSLQVEIEQPGGSPPPPRRLAFGAASAIGEAIRDRARAGQAAGRPLGTASNVPIIVPDGYTSQGEQTRRPGGRYVLTAELRRHRGTGHVSGGMWRGMSVKGGGNRAVLEFSGSSVGANPTFGATFSRRLVSNALKAETVLESQGVNVLAMNAGDRQAMQEAANVALALAADHALAGRIKWLDGPPQPRTALGQMILRKAQ